MSTTQPAVGGGRREEIRRLAATIMSEKGYERASMSDVAAAADMRKASLYHHFESKQALLFEILQEFQGEGQEIIARVSAHDGPVDRMRRLIEEHIRAIAEDPIRARLLSRELRSLEGDYLHRAMAHRNRYQAFVVDIIRSGHATGTFRADIDPEIAAVGILSMMNAMHQWFRAGKSPPLDHVTETFVNLILGGLIPGPTVATPSTTGAP